MPASSYSVPGVYRQPAVRAAGLPRVRTDVAGFVGVAGEARLYQATVLDDWRSYLETFLRDERGRRVEPPAGSRLADAVQAFFANGGARCVVVNIAPAIPESGDLAGRQALLSDMLGLPRDGAPTVDGEGNEVRFTGLELLLRQEEVALLVMPELDARITTSRARSTRDQPLFEAGRFYPCALRPALASGDSNLPPEIEEENPLFDDTELLPAQRYLLDRCAREPWRVFVILGTPEGRDRSRALKWRRDLGESGCGAIYWPWLREQTSPGRPSRLRSPVGAVAGVFSRRDLAVGPHAAPANEHLVGIVGLEFPIDDAANGELYDGGVNVIRAFPGMGLQLWGARTLQWTAADSLGDPEKEFLFVNVRRCLSAIERTVDRLGQAMTFEPNLPMLRLVLVQRVTEYLRQVMAAGALAGDRQEDCFFVRCDASNNPPDSIAAGRLVCDVGVAIAAPAEFIVFRVGRSEGVVEIEEGL